ncbi:MAG: phage tail tape measure protein, partial [Clostridia bacterium]|nr:phage tail tape measure protein [Clostridia bacterium]
MANNLNRSIKIYIDNSDAMANATALESKIAELRASLQKLNEQGKKDTQGYKAQEKALHEFEKSYGNYQYKIKETERILKNLSGATYKELESTRKILISQLKDETRGTEQYNVKLKALNAVQKEFNIAKKEMNSNVGQGATLMSRAANSFNKYFGMITSSIAAITGMSFAFRKLSQDAAKMDDVYADVMKTTGMNKDQVLDLNEAFKQMDTRTSREQLNMLARDAGKLGLQSKEDVLGFVEAANEIQVALGEDLGEGAVREVGKMVDVFTRSTSELEGLDLKGKMLAVGSAINELGASSSAQEDYLVQFAGRLGGVAAQANIGIDSILGFASVLDQDMQTVEMSATALQQILIKMMGDPAKFAQIAGVEVSKFTELVRTDANEAVKLLLRSLNEKGGFQELVPIFDEMGLSGTRAVGVLSSMASSVDKIDEAQRIANESMIQATSLSNEYNIKNNTMQARLDKLRESYKNSAEDLGKRLNPALLKSTNILTYIIKFLPTILDFFDKYGALLIKTTVLILAYNVALRAQTTWTKLALIEKIKLIAANVKEQASMVALNVRYIAGSRSMQEFNRSMKALFTTMKLNPFALAITALTAIGILLYENARRTRNLTNAAKTQADITKIAAENTARERAELNLLLSTARDETLSKEERRKAIKKLNEISPEYLSNLKFENINTQEATTAIDNYTTALMNNARQKAIADKVAVLYAKRLEKEGDIEEQNARKEGAGSEIRNLADRKIESINKEIASIDAQIKMYDNLNQAILKNNKIKNPPTSNNDTSSNDPFVPNATPTGAPSTNAYQEALTKLEAYIAREKALIQEKYIAGKISQEEYNRELEYLEMERLRKNLELAGLTFEQQQEIELKIFDTK